MHNTVTINITCLGVLKRLITHPTTNRNRHLRVIVDIPGLTGKQHQELENKTNRYLNSCGCLQGMTSGILLVVIRCLYFSAGRWIAGNFFLDLVILFFSGAVTGKLGTILFYRVNLGITIYRSTISLDRHYSFHPSNMQSHGTRMRKN